MAICVAMGKGEGGWQVREKGQPRMRRTQSPEST